MRKIFFIITFFFVLFSFSALSQEFINFNFPQSIDYVFSVDTSLNFNYSIRSVVGIDSGYLCFFPESAEKRRGHNDYCERLTSISKGDYDFTVSSSILLDDFYVPVFYYGSEEIIYDDVLILYDYEYAPELKPDDYQPRTPSGRKIGQNFNVNRSYGHDFEDLPARQVSQNEIDIEFPGLGAISKARFKDLDVDDDLPLGIEMLGDRGHQPPGLDKSRAQGYAIDPEELDFSSANFTVHGKGEEVHKCLDWNFEDQNCEGEWLLESEIEPGKDYNLTITPDDPGFIEYINISAAEHLDESRMVIDDIYDSVRRLDGNTVTIDGSEFVRVRFEENLTSSNDITIFGESEDDVSLEVYEVGTNNLVAEFDEINEFGRYQEFLNDLEGEQDSFDIKVIGGSIIIDHIIDPAMELLENPTFINHYDPWVLDEIQSDGESRWSSEGDSEGGSIYSNVFEDGNIISSQESTWSQEIDSVSSEIDVDGTYRINSDGRGNGRLEYATIEIRVYDTELGWQTIHSYTETETDLDTGWVSFGYDTYDPEGEITEVEVYMDVSVDGGNQDYEGEIWVDSVSVLAPETYDLTMQDPDGEGSVYVDSDEITDFPWVDDFSDGTNVDIEATPDSDWFFVEWLLDGSSYSSDESDLIFMDDDYELQAIFDTFYLDVIEPVGRGDVTIDGYTIDDNEYPYQDNFEDDVDVTIEANPDENWLFIEWLVDGSFYSDNEVDTITMDDNYEIQAVFESTTLTILDPQGLGDVYVDGVLIDDFPEEIGFQDDEEVDIEAVPEDLWFFEEWLVDGNYYSDDEIDTIIMDDDYELQAVFGGDFSYLTINEPDGAGEVYVEGELIEEFPYDEPYEDGETVSIEAVANESWGFGEWIVDGEHYSYSSDESITLDSDKEVNVTFIYYELDIQTNPVLDFGLNFADLAGELTLMEGYESADVWFDYRIEDDESWSQSSSLTVNEMDEFSEEITDLDDRTYYEYRAVTEDDGDLVYGDVLTFFTFPWVYRLEEYQSDWENYFSIDDLIIDSDDLILDFYEEFDYEQTFSYTGEMETIDVSNHVKIEVVMYGAGGGHGDDSDGGSGGYIEAVLNVSEFDQIEIWVGEGGSRGGGATFGRSSGGASVGGDSGSGGGSTEITADSESVFLIAADGAGGGGLDHPNNAERGGGGGAGGSGGNSGEDPISPRDDSGRGGSGGISSNGDSGGQTVNDEFLIEEEYQSSGSGSPPETDAEVNIEFYEEVRLSEGQRISPPLSLDTVASAGSSLIEWVSTESENTDIEVYTALTDDSSTEPTEWELESSGESISSFNEGDDLTDYYLWVRQDFFTSSQETPILHELLVEIEEEFFFNVQTFEPDVDLESATFYGNLTDMDDYNEVDVFFRYREMGESSWIETSHETLFELDNFTYEFTDIEEGIEYEYKAVAYASEDSRETTGEIETFMIASDEIISVDYNRNLFSSENQTFVVNYSVDGEGYDDECYLDIDYTYFSMDKIDGLWVYEDNYDEGFYDFTIDCDSDISSGDNYTSSFNVLDDIFNDVSFSSTDFNSYHVESEGSNVYFNDTIESYDGDFNTFNDFTDYFVFEEVNNLDIDIINFSYLIGLGSN